MTTSDKLTNNDFTRYDVRHALTDDMINDAKQDARLHSPSHEHNDCIRMAYEWLDAQKAVKKQRSADWKHIIERWCGRYITDDDVKIAVHLHEKATGRYPKINISSKLVFPSTLRLLGIAEAGRHSPPGAVGSPSIYHSMETDRR